MSSQVIVNLSCTNVALCAKDRLLSKLNNVTNSAYISHYTRQTTTITEHLLANCNIALWDCTTI